MRESKILYPSPILSQYIKYYWVLKTDEVEPVMVQTIPSSFLINEFSKSNKLKILAVYPDEDLDAWKEHVSVMPKDWINSYDKSVSLKNDEIYDLKAIPTLYLLNKEKKVLLKDATFQQIENYLSQTTN